MIQALAPVIVGAGPAGIRAAQTLVANGLRPVVVDESANWGGQIYRQPPAHFVRTKKELYGFESAKAQSVLSAMQGLLPHVDYRPHTLVWNVQGGQLDLLHQGQTSTLAYSQVIVTSGATDRILPFRGWTLPGVFSLGGAQVALKFQGCSIGKKVVFAGSGPLLYLVAYQYAKAGAHVVALLDSGKLSDQVAAMSDLLAQPAWLAKGLYYVAWLHAHGVAVHRGAVPLEAKGQDCLESLLWQDDRGVHSLACDAVATGYGLRSEAQLADLLDCQFVWNAVQGAWLPVCDESGRTSVSGVYLAGDGASVEGADAAEWSGERAALTLLSDRAGHATAEHVARSAALSGHITKRKIFGRGLARAFPDPLNWAAQTPDDLLVCRCEEVTAGDLRQTAAEAGVKEINRLKALSRVGMGRCQGRMCVCAAAEILAQCTGQSLEKVGRLRAQAPIKPIPFTTMLKAESVSGKDMA